MIEVRDLRKRYGEKLAVDGLTFTMDPGKVTGFLGPKRRWQVDHDAADLGLDRPTTGAATVDDGAHRDLADPLRTVGALLEAKAVHTGRV